MWLKRTRQVSRVSFDTARTPYLNQLSLLVSYLCGLAELARTSPLTASDAFARIGTGSDLWKQAVKWVNTVGCHHSNSESAKMEVDQAEKSQKRFEVKKVSWSTVSPAVVWPASRKLTSASTCTCIVLSGMPSLFGHGV